MAKRPIVTLMTDFGTSDHFVAATKASILNIHQEVDIVDLTHEIPAHDVFAGAFTLRNAISLFPRFTLHVAVVDPTVGSARRPILVMTDNFNFLGPDNGLFSYIYQDETVNRVLHVTAQHYFRHPVCPTFHARDIFAPIAGYICKGVDPRKVGDEISDYVRFDTPKPNASDPKMIRGAILHVDRFGNCFTNFTKNEVTLEGIRAGGRLIVNNREITKFGTHYAEAQPNELMALFSSTGLLEIAAAKVPAANLLQVRRGVEVVFAIP
ncbi:MAG: SAM-dependent chlorinase/fluorinase [Blastocatellia bacterium]|nr:SAM-dependent chlorinase/fluorinase [Blastocatellia bacterium]